MALLGMPLNTQKLLILLWIRTIKALETISSFINISSIPQDSTLPKFNLSLSLSTDTTTVQLRRKISNIYIYTRSPQEREPERNDKGVLIYYYKLYLLVRIVRTTLFRYHL